MAQRDLSVSPTAVVSVSPTEVFIGENVTTKDDFGNAEKDPTRVTKSEAAVIIGKRLWFCNV